MDTTQINLLNLVQQDTKLRKCASTNGGEWGGPCPFCGGKDRFRVWPHPASGSPRYWCRQCEESGDAISYVMKRDAVDFQAACDRLHLKRDLLGFHFPPVPGVKAVQPRTTSEKQAWPALSSDDWQREADLFHTRCFDAFWQTSRGQLSPGREYALMRGLTDGACAAFELGYNPRPYRAMWGDQDVWLPMGLVIPHVHEGVIWTLNVRRMDGKSPKYIRPKGSANSLFLTCPIRPKSTVVMVEGELDAITLWQETRGLPIVPVATGSTHGAFLTEWIVELSIARQIVLAFDADDAGEKAVQRWRQAFPRAQRLTPTRHDVNDMLRAGDDVRQWLQQGIVQMESQEKKGIRWKYELNISHRTKQQCTISPVRSVRRWPDVMRMKATQANRLLMGWRTTCTLSPTSRPVISASGEQLTMRPIKATLSLEGEWQGVETTSPL